MKQSRNAVLPSFYLQPMVRCYDHEIVARLFCSTHLLQVRPQEPRVWQHWWPWLSQGVLLETLPDTVSIRESSCALRWTVAMLKCISLTIRMLGLVLLPTRSHRRSRLSPPCLLGQMVRSEFCLKIITKHSSIVTLIWFLMFFIKF